MNDGEATMAWILFWVFSGITTVAAFLIADHHRSRRFAILLTLLSAAFFVGLYTALGVLLRYLGL
jgi:hypothetical protein